MPAQGIVRHLVAIAHGLHSMIRDDEIELVARREFGRAVGYEFHFPPVWHGERRVSRHAVLVKPGAAGDARAAVREFLADKERVGLRDGN